MMLEKLGHEILKAYSGSEGIILYEANRHQIDLIISDFNMPGMNGQQVVDKLRIMDYSVKALLSSGGLNVMEEEEAIDRGFNGFLKKPFNITALSDKIVEILN
jgi:CheY-like chemotaxis protein